MVVYESNSFHNPSIMFFKVSTGKTESKFSRNYSGRGQYLHTPKNLKKL